MRALLDTSVLIGADDPGELEGAMSAASLAELHFGVLIARDEDERALRALRLGVVESTFEPLPIDAAGARAQSFDRSNPRLSTPRSPASGDDSRPPYGPVASNHGVASSSSPFPRPP